MNPIFPILQIKSDKKVIDLSTIDYVFIYDFGNGFFISQNGLIASVAHVLKSENDINAFALFNGKLYKADILLWSHTNNDEYHLDAAIGKLDLANVDYFNPIKFERVEISSYVKIKGFYRKSTIKEFPQQFNLLNSKCSFYEIQANCLDLTYAYNSNIDRKIMKNLFTIVPDATDIAGMSGCPIVNENNEVVGIFKGGATNNLNQIIWCSAVHIEIIKEMILKLKSKL